MSISSWMMDPTCPHAMSSCSAIDFAEIWQISWWIWSIISRVVTVLCHPGRSASQVEKSPRWNWATQFWWWHKMVHVPLVFLSQWCEFASAPCLAKKKNLMIAHVYMLLKLHTLPDLLPFSPCNKKRVAFRHMNRSFFPVTWSSPVYDIGK